MPERMRLMSKRGMSSRWIGPDAIIASDQDGNQRSVQIRTQPDVCRCGQLTNKMSGDGFSAGAIGGNFIYSTTRASLDV